MQRFRAASLIAAALLCAFPALAQTIKIKPIAVSGSGVGGGTRYAYAVDDNNNNYWTAGGYAPQYIDLDLGRPIALNKVRLLTSQSPAGFTAHEVYVGNAAPSGDTSALRKIWTLSGNTADNQWLEKAGDADDSKPVGLVRWVRIKTTASPSWVGWREIELVQGAQNVGFYGSEFDGQAQGDPTTETVALGANTTMIASGSTAFIDQKLAAAKAQGAQAVVSMAAHMFEWMFDGNGNCTGQRLRLKPAATLSQNLSAVAAVVAKYPGAVASFYPYDEPYTVGLRCAGLTDPVTGGMPTDPTKRALAEQELTAIKEELLKARSELNARFPGVPVSSVATRDPIDLGRTPDFFAMFDWIGFDCYEPWGVCGDTLISDFRKLLSRPEQRLIAVPWAFRWLPAATSQATVAEQGEVIANMSQWHQQLLKDGRYVTALPFLWNTVKEGSRYMVGSRSLPLVKRRSSQLALSLLNKPLSYEGWAVTSSGGSVTTRRILPVKANASASYTNTLPFMATDGDTGNYWTAGDYARPNAPQWLEFDFGGSVRLNNIDLLVTQSPAGLTEHVLEAGTRNTSGSCVYGGTAFGSFKGTTSDAQVLKWQGQVDAECVRVKTLSSPSWVGWVEIKFGQTVLPLN